MAAMPRDHVDASVLRYGFAMRRHRPKSGIAARRIYPSHQGRGRGGVFCIAESWAVRMIR